MGCLCRTDGVMRLLKGLMFLATKVTNALIFMFVIAVLSGCTAAGNKSDKYYEAAKEFNKVYFEIAERVDDKNDINCMIGLQSGENTRDMEKLKELLSEIEQSIPKDNKMLYLSFSNRYEDLVLIRNVYPNYGNLSPEERGKIHGAVTMIGYYVTDRKNKKSNTVWE